MGVNVWALNREHTKTCNRAHCNNNKFVKIRLVLTFWVSLDLVSIKYQNNRRMASHILKI